MVNNTVCAAFKGLWQILVGPPDFLGLVKRSLESEREGKNTLSGKSRIQVWQKQPKEKQKKDGNGEK